MPSQFLDFSGEVQPIQHHASSARVLCLSGGGFRGIFTARVLANLEKVTSRSANSQFDVIVGTSTGSLIAAALALGISAKTVETAYSEIGREIFRPRWQFPVFKWPRLSASVSRLFISAPYEQANLRRAIRHLVGGDNAGKSLKDLDIPFMSVALRHSDAKTLILGAGKFVRDSPEMSLEDALVSSTAAPTYFPSFEYNNTSLLDGGLTANAPELVAISLVRDRLGVPMDKVTILSIGTGAPSPGVLAFQRDRRSTIRWLLSARGLVQLTLAAQESLACDIAKTMIGENYCRIDRLPSTVAAKCIGGLDNTSASAASALLSLAEEVWATFIADPASPRFLAL